MTTLQTIDHSPKAILHRIDVILEELVALRQVVQQMEETRPDTDLVELLAGSLGPAAPDEIAYFNQLDVTWQRFTDEPTNQ